MARHVYGYSRVSTREQNEDRQIIALKDAGVPDGHIFLDKQSGKDFVRPQYRKLLRKLKKDDLLFIKSIDRLGRNYEEVLEQWRVLTKEKKVDIVVMDMPILDTRMGKDLLGTLIADLVLAIFSYVSENERYNIKNRQKEGIQAAKQRGVQFGRPAKPLPEDFDKICQAFLQKEINAEEAARRCDFTKQTFYHKLKEWNC